MKKSTRHSKITGDFAEGLVLYWLSKHGYECARVDHTGIDLIARKPRGPLMGISVKSRSRYKRTEKTSVNLPQDGFQKAKSACKAFKCVPYYAIVVDGGERIRCFLLSLGDLMKVADGAARGMRYWGMSDRHLEKYRQHRRVKSFELKLEACSWRDKHD